jgi:hypothetical protein
VGVQGGHSVVQILLSSQTVVVKVLCAKSHERMVEYEFDPPFPTTTWATGFVVQSQTPASTTGKREYNNSHSHSFLKRAISDIRISVKR